MLAILSASFLSLSVAAAPQQGSSLTLELGRISHPAFSLDNVRVTIQREGEAASLSIGRFSVGDLRWDALSLNCPEFRLAGGRLRCRGGVLRASGVEGGVRTDLDLEPARKTARLVLDAGEGESIQAEVKPDGRAHVTLNGISLARLGQWVPAASDWGPAGYLDGVIDYRSARAGPSVNIEGSLRELKFADNSGLHAGESIAARIGASVAQDSRGWNWDGRIEWTAGEAYFDPVYFTSGPSVEARGHFASDLLVIDHAELAIEGVQSIAANAEVELSSRSIRRAALSVVGADLAVIGPRYVAPVIAPARVEQLRFAGHVSAGIELKDDAIVRANLAFAGAGFSVADGKLAFGPLSGRVPWAVDTETEANISVDGGRWEKLNLGAFDVRARVHGRSVDVERVTIPVLDGALILNALALRRGATGWFGSGGAVVEPISMALLTDAIGFPQMSGVLSASLPGVRVAPGEVTLDGALVVSVFDGYFQATRLQVLEPFGLTSRLYADIEARHLNLSGLTETFSFGEISGFLDADVLGLELVRWRPVRFDARVASSPGSYPRRISQRAVQNISALGGAGAAAAIQRSFLGFFETFGYREIGLSCSLRGAICRMGGLEEGDMAAGGYYLVRGGGIPALNVIGYNRRVDWNELIGRLQRVIASNAAPVVQ